MMPICISNLTVIGSDNGLLPGRHQAIICTNAGILLTGTLGTNFIEILSEILTFSLKKMHLKMSSVKWWPFCLGLNVLTALNYLNVCHQFAYQRKCVHTAVSINMSNMYHYVNPNCVLGIRAFSFDNWVISPGLKFQHISTDWKHNKTIWNVW